MKHTPFAQILCISLAVTAFVAPGPSQTFLQAPPLPPQGIPAVTQRACCDVDGDLLNDVVAVESGGIVVMMGNENGSLRPGVVVAAGTFGNVDCCDMDGDGQPDIIADTNGFADVLLFINQSTPGFPAFAPGTAPVTGVVGTVSNLQCCDLDLDGDNDILATDAANQQLLIWQSCIAQGCSPAAPLAAPQTTSLNQAPFVQNSFVNTVICCDMSQSTSGPDIVVTQFQNGTSTITVLLNYAGISSFQAGMIVTLTNPAPTVNGPVFDLACCDMDGQLGSDVVVGHGGQVSVLLAQGTATPTGPFLSGNLPGNVTGLDCCDVEGDGVVDIIVAARALVNSLQIIPGLFGGATPFVPQPAGIVFGPQCCDVDNDGDPEIIVDQSNGTARNYLTFVNQTNGPSMLTYPGTGGPLAITSGVSPTGGAVGLSGGPLADVKSTTNNDTIFVNITDAGGGAAGQFVLVLDLFNTSVGPTFTLGFWVGVAPQLFGVGTGTQTFSFAIPPSPVLNGFSVLAQGYAVPAPLTWTTSAAHEFQLR
ncbi:MAG: VCBS repeat-containing protein [Planctomycetota bacterium]